MLEEINIKAPIIGEIIPDTKLGNKVIFICQKCGKDYIPAPHSKSRYCPSCSKVSTTNYKNRNGKRAIKTL